MDCGFWEGTWSQAYLLGPDTLRMGETSSKCPSLYFTNKTCHSVSREFGNYWRTGHPRILDCKRQQGKQHHSEGLRCG